MYQGQERSLALQIQILQQQTEQQHQQLNQHQMMLLQNHSAYGMPPRQHDQQQQQQSAPRLTNMVAPTRTSPSSSSSSSTKSPQVPISSSNQHSIPKRPPKRKTELRGASQLVLDTPPIISISANGWKACCLTLCKCAYVRNNKRGGLKNLRCFPHCLPEGHNPLGFCGSSIYTRVWLPSTVNPVLQ